MSPALPVPVDRSSPRTALRVPGPGHHAHLALDYLFDLPAEQRTAQRLFDLFREAWTGLRADPDYSGLFETLDDERAWGIESLEFWPTT